MQIALHFEELPVLEMDQVVDRDLAEYPEEVFVWVDIDWSMSKICELLGHIRRPSQSMTTTVRYKRFE